MVVIKDRVSGLLGDVESTIALSSAHDVVDLSTQPHEEPGAIDLLSKDSERDELLGIPEGFDLVLPDLLTSEDEE
jgi:hypothetical protein